MHTVVYIRDMQKKGWLPSEKVLLPAAALTYWGFTSIEEFATLEKASQRACFRRSQKFESYNFHFALTWLHKVKTLLEQESITSIYSPQNLLGLAEEIPDYSQRKQGILLFLRALQGPVPHRSSPRKTYTDGASLWFQGNPVIALTNRFDRNDNFWFTITHEIGHILLHLDDLKKNHAYIDSIDGKDESRDERETEADADAFARKHLKIDDILRFFELRQRISEKAVTECARILNLHPALIVGCLQHEGRISYKLLNRHKEPVKHLLQPFFRGIEETTPALPRRRNN
ncbi:MAG: ImmA/IrrE family metallo-endopeptidase [Candidatus Riflebacteria bacterium]|nr:ImmA/IrrE family metallo-endopeptidase [Candidatus Riflebacteria bacterium]